MSETAEKPCPTCDGRGRTEEQSADRGNRTYSFPCLACNGTGWVKR